MDFVEIRPFFITDLLIPLLSSSKLIVTLSLFNNNKLLPLSVTHTLAKNLQ